MNVRPRAPQRMLLPEAMPMAPTQRARTKWEADAKCRDRCLIQPPAKDNVVCPRKLIDFAPCSSFTAMTSINQSASRRLTCDYRRSN